MPTETFAPEEAPDTTSATDTSAELGDRAMQARTEVAELLSTPPELAARLRPKLHAVIDTAIARTGDPQLQRNLRLLGGLQDYRLFGRPGEPLPPGLVMTGNNFNAAVEYDTRIDFCGDCYGEASNALKPDQHDTLLAIRQETDQALAERRDSVMAGLVKYIRTLPAFHHLEGLGSELPSPPPPPHTNRLLREGRLREQIAAKYPGVDIEDQTPQGAMARREYQTEQARLELEEELAAPTSQVHAKRGVQPPSVVTAKARFEAYLRQSDAMRLDGESLQDLLSSKFDFENALISGMRDLSIFTPGTAEDKKLSMSVVKRVALLVMDKSFKGTYQQALEQAVQKAAETYCDLNASVEYASVYAWRMPPNALIAGSELTPYDQQHRAWHAAQRAEQSAEGVVYFVPIEELIRQRNTTVGTVVRAPFGDAQRLMQSMGSAPPEDFSSPHATESLVITLSPKEFTATPHIDGYRLTSAQRGSLGIRFGFEKDPAGDPRARATMLLPEAQKTLLAQKYNAIGLHSLAAAVDNSTNLNVAELVELVQAATHYPIARGSKRANLPPPFAPKKIEDFAQLVKNKQLWAQCNASAPLLALSLQLCGFEAGTTGGISLNPGESLIKELHHAETYLVHEGRRYLLDATGEPSAAGRLLLRARSLGHAVGERIKLFRRVGKQQAPPAIQAPEVLPIPRQRLPEQNTPKQKRDRQEVLDGAVSGLEQALAPLFGTRTPEGLYKVLGARQLREADPIRRTLTTLRQVARGTMQPAELAKVNRLLHNYQANRAVRQRLGYPNYDPAILHMLEGYVTQAQAAFARS